MVADDDVEGVVVSFLLNSSPSSNNMRIEAALRAYIARLDDETHQRILPGWVKGSKKRKSQRKQPVRELDEIERGALAFLGQRQRERARENKDLVPTVNREAVLGGITGLREGFAWNCKNAVQSLWGNENDSVITSERFRRSSPIERLGLLHADALSSAHANECKRRITALLIHRECKQKGVATGKKAAEYLARVTGLPLASAKDVDPTAQSWLRFMEVWGLGGLVIPGYGHKAAFERNLSIEQFQDLRDFCEKELPCILAKSESMHRTVAKLLIQAMHLYEGDEEAFRSGPGRLANIYRTYCERGRSDTWQPSPNASIDLSISPSLGSNALDTLAEVARSQLPNNHMSGSHTARVGPYPSSNVLGARNNGPADPPAQTPASDQDSTIYGATLNQTLPPQWRTYAENCQQQTSTDQVPVNGPQTFPSSGIGHSSITNGEQKPLNSMGAGGKHA